MIVPFHILERVLAALNRDEIEQIVTDYATTTGVSRRVAGRAIMYAIDDDWNFQQRKTFDSADTMLIDRLLTVISRAA
jgi:hypothetical protein